MKYMPGWQNELPDFPTGKILIGLESLISGHREENEKKNQGNSLGP